MIPWYNLQIIHPRKTITLKSFRDEKNEKLKIFDFFEKIIF